MGDTGFSPILQNPKVHNLCFGCFAAGHVIKCFSLTYMYFSISLHKSLENI